MQLFEHHSKRYSILSKAIVLTRLFIYANEISHQIMLPFAQITGVERQPCPLGAFPFGYFCLFARRNIHREDHQPGRNRHCF